MRILIIEDDVRIAENIKTVLEKNTYSVDLKHNAQTGQDQALDEEYDLIILDWMLPDFSGPEVCANLRERNVTTPVLMLTAKAQLEDKIKGLNQGADDYLTKPFQFEELVARVRALIRRNYPTEQSPKIIVGDLEIDTNKCLVSRQGKKIDLSPKLYALLEYLARNNCQVLSRMDILSHVWDANVDMFTNTVDVHIRYLRKKIDEDYKIKLIKTVKGKGYMLCEN